MMGVKGGVEGEESVYQQQMISQESLFFHVQGGINFVSCTFQRLKGGPEGDKAIQLYLASRME